MFNKFPILSNHLLVISKEFEPQNHKLNITDFEAVLIGMKALETGVSYMNCGINAGASQPHKHLQVIPESELRITGGRLPLTLAIENTFSSVCYRKSHQAIIPALL